MANKTIPQINHEVTNEAGFEGGALFTGWKNSIGDMFKMSFDNFKAMVITWAPLGDYYTAAQVDDLLVGFEPADVTILREADLSVSVQPYNANTTLQGVITLASLGGTTDHDELSNIGVNTHAQIDTHLADASVHFTQAAITITESQISDLGNYQLVSQKGAALGYAPLDASAKIATAYLPDSILGQVAYQGTWDGISNIPAIPAAAAGNKGHYYITSSDVAVGHGHANVPNVDFKVGDWIISDGTSWSKVDNTDAVATVFGRLGAVVAVEADYESFYPKLSGSYNNPAWVNQLAWSKITGRPTTLAGYGITDAAAISHAMTSHTATNWRMFYSNGSATVVELALAATGNALISGGASAAPSWGKVGLTTHISGTLAVGNGGSGATTLTGVLVGNGSSAFTAIAGTANQMLRRNAGNTAYEFFTPTFGSGTVTSVGMTVPTGLSVAGSPITGAGNLAVTFTAGYSIPTDANQANWTTAFGWGNHAAAGYQLTSEKGAALGYAPLDASAKIATAYLPDSILGQVEYQSTWAGATNTPAIPAAAAGNKGHYYITSSDVAAGHGYANVPNVDFKTGDWIISDGTSWSKVDNTDAVATVFGRMGAVVAVEADYESFYPKLSSSYNNPAWVNQLAWSKITGSPTTLAGYGITDAAAISHTHAASDITAGTLSAGTYNLTGQLNVDNLRLDGNTLSSTNANGQVVLTSTGIGNVVLNSVQIDTSGVVSQLTRLFNDVDLISIDSAVGFRIDCNVTFDDVTVTIAGIQNQNLVDKSTSETITGEWYFDGGARIDARVQTTTGGSTTITSDSKDFLSGRGLTSALTLPNPSGTPTQGQPLLICLEDNGTARSITWSGAQWRAMGVTLPTTTVLGKVMYIACVWDSVDSKWDVLSVINEA